MTTIWKYISSKISIIMFLSYYIYPPRSSIKYIRSFPKMASVTMSNLKELLGITQEIFPEISRLIQIMLTYPVLEQVYYDPWQVCQPGTDASISDISVLNSFVSSGPTKLVFRRLGEGRIFLFLLFWTKNPLFTSYGTYFLSGILLFLTLKLT